MSQLMVVRDQHGEMSAYTPSPRARPVTIAEGTVISTDLVLGPSLKGGSELRLDPDPVSQNTTRLDENLQVDLVLPSERGLLGSNGDIGAFSYLADSYSAEKCSQELRTATEARRKNRDDLLLGFSLACVQVRSELRGRGRPCHAGEYRPRRLRLQSSMDLDAEHESCPGEGFTLAGCLAPFRFRQSKAQSAH